MEATRMPKTAASLKAVNVTFCQLKPSNPQTLASEIKFLLSTLSPEHPSPGTSVRTPWSFYFIYALFLSYIFLSVKVIILEQVYVIGGMSNYWECNYCHIYTFLSSTLTS